MTALLLLLLVLATYRLTRFITTDRITQAPRVALVQRWGEESLKGYLLTCDQCVSVYTSALVVGLTWVWQPLDLPALVWGAVAGGVSLTAIVVDRLEA